MTLVGASWDPLKALARVNQWSLWRRSAQAWGYSLQAMNSGDNRLAASSLRRHQRESQVKVERLDRLLRGVRVDFVKIDVQGWERQVFEGMSKLLEQNQELKIFVGYWPHGLENVGSHPRELLEYLRGCGFTISQAGSRRDTSITDLDDFERKIRMLRTTNLLLTRRNKPDLVGPECTP